MPEPAILARLTPHQRVAAQRHIEMVYARHDRSKAAKKRMVADYLASFLPSEPEQPKAPQTIIDQAIVVPCKRHQAKPGEPCWPIYTNDRPQVLRAVCAGRMSARGVSL